MKETCDGAEPAANSVSALNLLRMGRMLHDEEAEGRARQILAAHAGPIELHAVPQMMVALDLALSPPEQLVIAGALEESRPLIDGFAFRPRAAKILLDSPQAVEFFAKHSPAVREMTKVAGKAALYECRDFTCRPPVTAGPA